MKLKDKNKMLLEKLNKMLKPTAVDIFAGGGGLSVGLKRAGFQVVSAVELEPHAFATYKANHPEVKAFLQDVRTISGKSLLECSPTGKIDLLSGCPPCQGFSSLTAKYKREDPRNQLIKEMSRLVLDIKPSIVMMENVPGLSNKGKPMFDELLQTLEDAGYIVNWGILQVADYGIPQSRRRLVILAGRGFSIELPQPTHSRNRKNGLKPWKTLRDTISDTAKPHVLSEVKKLGDPRMFKWNVVRDLSPQTLARLQAAKAGESRFEIPMELRPLCHQKNLDGFQGVYGRMSWEQVSVTITGGCTTVSKGRFGHPEEDRTISVREAALIQTFPVNYIIDTPYMDYACDIVGNALPCDFAEVIAQQCFFALEKKHSNLVGTSTNPF